MEIEPIRADRLPIHNNRLYFGADLDPVVRIIAQRILDSVRHPSECMLSFAVDNNTIFYHITSQEEQSIEGALAIENTALPPLSLAEKLREARNGQMSKLEVQAFKDQLLAFLIKNFHPLSTTAKARLSSHKEEQKHAERKHREHERDTVKRQIVDELIKELKINEENVYDATVNERNRHNG